MNSPDLLYLVIVLVSVLVSMTLHEAMHAFVGYWLGDDTAKLEGRLTLNPIAHIDPFTTVLMPLLLAASGLPPFGAAKPVPINPFRIRYGEWGAALVGVAGPLTNLALALVTGLLLRFAGHLMDPFTSLVLFAFTVVNISFFAFNMIPFPPLDGSRVLYAIAPEPVQRLMERIEAMGFAAIILFIVIFYAVLSTPFAIMVLSIIRWITGVAV